MDELVKQLKIKSAELERAMDRVEESKTKEELEEALKKANELTFTCVALQEEIQKHYCGDSGPLN